MYESVDFLVGEKKNVTIAIRSGERKPFKVTEATWSLCLGDEVESEGKCYIDHLYDGTVNVSALIRPMRAKALYKLVYTYTIPPEQFLYRVKVRTC